MMERFEIIDKIGSSFYSSNLENGEFSYSKGLKSIGKSISDYRNSNPKKKHNYLDIRFENDRLIILVETKNRFDNWDKTEIQQQLQEYVKYEKVYSDRKIVAILAETEGNNVWTWYGQSVIIDDEHVATNLSKILSFEEYEELCFGKVNDKLKVVDSIKVLNELLHSDGITEKLRSQFVGTCLLSLKNGLVYEGIKPTKDKSGKELKPEQVILKNIKEILEGLLSQGGDLNKVGKLAILNNKVLEDQDVTSLSYQELKSLLAYIDNNIVPYINDKNTAGQDLLNLFFTTFNKYVGKSDKNQAFTPDHICDFMSKVVNVNKNSRVLDPCCGSGAFLVRAMTDAMDDCNTENERDTVKKSQIFGIEYEDGAFGLSSTNMLIHGDGNSNIIQDSMFNKGKWITDANIDVILMNPPYNATKKSCDPEYTKKWASKVTQDPSKGLHFVEWVARQVTGQGEDKTVKNKTAKIAVLLPMQAAIGNSKETKLFKKKMLEKYTLEAVFSLPDEMFYPGASAVACCMIFDLSQNHTKSDKDTFFGYFKDDNFIKRKGLGRVEKVDSNGDSLWEQVKSNWLSLYRNKREVAGLSVMKKVGYEDEWLAEAYMETDYSTLNSDDFQRTINHYLSFLVKEGECSND
ncbi:HsdM family class I SAM-dependent methyltransferase [Streptococcus sp. 20-1249]|uniref:HsdM family class I SAM-dependent methyltransferase n=1 Tax=Streptococcus hepaticus TaxID=3349163 RepID=UPI00374A916E